ncbi:ZHX3 isoform 6, partial [Pongo abelii]
VIAPGNRELLQDYYMTHKMLYEEDLQNLCDKTQMSSQQTEFDLINMKDWPVWETACQVEEPNPTLCCHMPFPCPAAGHLGELPESSQTAQSLPLPSACPPPSKQQARWGSHQFFLPQCRTFPLPSNG